MPAANSFKCRLASGDTQIGLWIGLGELRDVLAQQRALGIRSHPAVA
ncbi:hypothetical protein [Sinisalibacter aestuarii]|nr:hypothetical protein [Sinisalibacter aestuarii]